MQSVCRVPAGSPTSNPPPEAVRNEFPLGTHLTAEEILGLTNLLYSYSPGFLLKSKNSSEFPNCRHPQLQPSLLTLPYPKHTLASPLLLPGATSSHRSTAIQRPSGWATDPQQLQLQRSVGQPC